MTFSPALTAPPGGFGFNLGTAQQVASYIPVVGNIASNLGSVAGAIGIDTKTPAQHIAERSANGELLKSAAIGGNNLAWEKLWVASGRPLPVRRVSEVARVGDNTATKNVNEFFGWARVGEQLTAMLREVENFRGAPPPPTGATQGQIIGMLTQQVLQSGAVMTATQGGTFGGMGFGGIGDSPQNHDGAQSNAPPSSTNYVVVGAIILAMLFVLKRR